MRWLTLPDGFLRASDSVRSEIGEFFTELHLRWVETRVDDPERYRLAQVTIPAMCAVLWAGCRDAANGVGRIRRLDHYITTFQDMNRSILFGAWPPDPVDEALTSLPFFSQHLKWRACIERRDSYRFAGVFPELSHRPSAMSPVTRSAYPTLLWIGQNCRVVLTEAEENTARLEGWHAYGDPDVEKSAQTDLKVSDTDQLSTRAGRLAAVRGKLARVSEECGLNPPYRHQADFWKAAGYKDRSTFENWLAEGAAASLAADDAFRKLLDLRSELFKKRREQWKPRPASD